MSGIALRVEPSECEPATSWASRLAERNGCETVQDFVHDMGISWKTFRIGDLESITALCELTKVDAWKLLRTTYMKGESATSKWIGDEWIAPKLMRFDRIRVCPNCVGDARYETNGFLQSGAPVWWYMEGLRICPVHERALLQLPPPDTGRCKHDYAGRVRDNRSLIHATLNSAEKLEVGNCERYVINRLKFGASRSPHWIDNFDLGTVIRASEQLGLVALNSDMRNQKVADERILFAATSRGFAVLSDGPLRFAKELERLRPERSKGGFYTDFFLSHVGWNESNTGQAALCYAMPYATLWSTIILAPSAKQFLASR